MTTDNENKALVLIVEDDRRLAHINRYALESEGYEVRTAYTLKEAREILPRVSPDVILLDVKLPDGSGFDLCREIREKTAAHIIFLTSVTETSGEMEGLIAGGDDYLRKPYGVDLLCRRVKKGLRRNPELPQTIRRGALELDILASRAYIGGEDLPLSPKEFSLLLLFMQNEEKILSAEYIYEKIWKQPMIGDGNALKSAVKRLRAGIDGCGRRIETVYGKGYRFEKE